MAFPATPLGLILEWAYGADLTASPSSWSWTDESQYGHHPTKLTSVRGATDRYTQAPPSRVALSLQNTTSRIWTPTHPMADLYGRIDINTPFRWLVRPDTNRGADTFTRTSSSSWGAADAGGSWTNAGGAASDFAVSTANGGRHTNTAASAPHYSTLAFSMVRVDITFRVRVNALSTGGPQTIAAVSRYASASASNRVELRFNTDQTMAVRLVSRSGGTDTAQAPITVGFTHVAATWYRFRVQFGKTSIRAKVWLDGNTEPNTWTVDGSQAIVFNTSAGAAGVYTMREAGNTNANATSDFDDLVILDGPRIQNTTFADEWQTTWTDSSARQSLVPLPTSGQLRRVSNDATQRSALYRGHTIDYLSETPSVVAYWSMEDGSTSRQFASAVGGPPMTFSNFSPASNSGMAGSDPLPVAGNGGGTFSAAVRKYTSPSPNCWSVRAAAEFPTAASLNSVLLQWYTVGGNAWRWQIAILTGSPDTVKLQAFDSAGAEKLGSAGVNFVDSLNVELYGKQLYFAAGATQNGSNIDWQLFVGFVDANGEPATVNIASSVAGTLGNVSRPFHTVPNGFTAGGYTFGHVAVGTSLTFGPANADAVTGYAGEKTNGRLTRLCLEQNFVALFGDLVTGSGATTQTMGPQSTTTFINQLREVESTEQGILIDSKQGHVQLLPRSMRRNHSVDLVLDFDNGDVTYPFGAVYDYVLLRNDVTVTNADGSSARLIGAGAVAPKRIGTFPDPVSVNVHDETDLGQIGEFRLARGTVREERFPTIMLNLAGSPNLIDQWLNCDVGSFITLANLPDQLDPSPLTLVIDGYTEIVDSVSWIVTLNCSSATVLNAFTLEASGNQGRLDSYTSALLAGYDSTSTSLLVARGPHRYGKSSAILWSTTSEPYDFDIAGERVTVGTMTAPTGSFVAAGTAVHGDNASLVPGLPAGIQKGDELLLLAAIRNTAATANSVSNPGGWSVLADGGNVVLFSQIWDGTFTAPTVGFQGGSAGDTTSAQIAALRSVQNVLVASSVIQSNGSAQNIAVPSIAVPRDRCMTITCGWKQDDWTSVATLPFGTEIGEPSSTTGNDQGLVWDYFYLASATTPGTTTFTVTGGASAISKAFVVALATDVQQATVTRSVNGVVKPQSIGAAVNLWRPGRVAL